MFNWKHFKMLMAVLLLTGCTLTPEVVKAPTYHPPLPEPYATCEHIEWEYIITEDNKARPSLSYQHGLDLSLCRDDMIRYLKQSTKIIEYYRNEKP